MRKPLLLLVCVCIIAAGAVVYAVVPSGSDDERGLRAQDAAAAPIFASEVYQWCVESCNGGNDEFQPNSSASFSPRDDGSLYFVTNVNFSACPSITIPAEIGGWYFGTSRSQIAAAQATAQVSSEVVEWETTGVQQITEETRDNPDLMICEAVFVRGGE